MSAKGKFIAIVAAIAVILAAAVIYSDYKEEQKAKYDKQIEAEEKKADEKDKEPTPDELKEAVREKLSGRAFGAETDAGYIVYSFGPYGVKMSCYQDSSSDSLLIVTDSGQYSLSDDLSEITIRLISGGNQTYDFEVLRKSIKLDGYKFRETNRKAEE